MDDLESAEVERTRRTNRSIWLVLTVLLTFISGEYASQGDWPLFWVMLALWVFTGFVLAVCHPGLRHVRK